MISGKERPEINTQGPKINQVNSAGAKLLDHHGNGALMVGVYGGGQTTLIDNTTTVDTEYIGYAAPGSDTVEGRADTRWRIMEVKDTGIRWAYTTLDPATPGTGPDYAGRPEHAWNDRASLNYA